MFAVEMQMGAWRQRIIRDILLVDPAEESLILFWGELFCIRNVIVGMVGLELGCVYFLHCGFVNAWSDDVCCGLLEGKQ